MGSDASKFASARYSEVVAPGDATHSPIYRNKKFVGGLVPTAFPEVRTMYDAFERGLKVNPTGRCLGSRKDTGATKEETDERGRKKTVKVFGEYVWKTYKEVGALRDAVGSALVNKGMAPPNDLNHRAVGLYSKNREEWVVAEQACHAYGLVDVALYDTLGEEAIHFIVEQTGMATVFASGELAPKLVAAKKAASLPSFKFVVSFDAVSAALVAEAAAVGLTLLEFKALVTEGAASPLPHSPPSPDDLSFICYTSGTTGMPKGALMLHRNLVAESSSAVTADLGLSVLDCHISYLPLAHIMERLVQCAFFMLGAHIGFYQGDTLKIAEDLVALRPTVFVSVPRLWNKMYDKISGRAAAAGGVKSYLFATALESKRYWLKQSNLVTHTLWDRLVFKPIAAQAGLDRVRVMITGSAPIAPHVMEFLKCVFCTRMVEGYGQTECMGAATLTNFEDQASFGHVGAPLACNEVRLEAVPDGGFLTTDTSHGREVDKDGTLVNPGLACSGRGEVCYRGHNVFAGYYKEPEKTKEALDADGWLHSGDIGLIDSLGNLRIIDRKKNIFKLSQGEYVAAEKIENVYIKAGLLGQAFVYGDSLHSMLVAVFTPDTDAVKRWAKDKPEAEGKSMAELCTLPALRAAVAEQIEKEGVAAKLQSFEKVRHFVLDDIAWTPEDLLTPSFKLKRADAKKKYMKEIDRLYTEAGDLVGGKSGLKQGSA